MTTNNEWGWQALASNDTGRVRLWLELPDGQQYALLFDSTTLARELARNILGAALLADSQPAPMGLDLSKPNGHGAKAQPMPEPTRPWSYENQPAALPLVIGDSVILECVEWLMENQSERAAVVLATMNGAQVRTALNVGAALARLALERLAPK